MPKKEYRLWTPIANALDAYRRRLVWEPNAVYEHVWRLIHIHESLIVTLGAALASRLLTVWTPKDGACDEANRLRRDEANRLRRVVTGLAVPGSPESDIDLTKGDPSCLGGFIKPWIDLLKDFANDAAAIECDFCKKLAGYLTEKPETSLAFVETWKRIAEVPQVFVGELSRVDRFDAVNTLRNKLAHVPVPHRILKDLHKDLRQELFSMMSREYKPQSDSPSKDYETTRWHDPLLGRIVSSTCVLTGSRFIQEQASLPRPDCVYLDAQTLDEKPNNPWCASPFIRVDEELKVSLLFLLSELRTDPSAQSFKGDYHRFAAESQPVQKEVVPRALVEDWIPTLPPPTKSTITSSQSDPSAPVQTDERTPSQPSAVALSAEVPAEDLRTLSAHQLRRVGDEAFRVRDYKMAVDAFNLLAERHGDSSEYNDVAKSKHGGSLWRIAEQESMGSDEKEEHIRRAVDLLEQASRHRDPQYRARAHYERSKALWHLWRLLDDVSYLQQARDVASEAARLQNEPSFVSWYEKVRDDLELSAPSRTGAG